MKNMRKLACLLLALVMVLGLATTAMAEDTATTNKGSITITNAKEGETYTAVKLFDATVNGTAIAYTYSGNTLPTGVSDYFEFIGETNYVQAKAAAKDTDGKLTADAVAALKTWAANQTAAGSVTPTADGSAVIFNLDYGYYIVTTTLGTAISVDSTKPNVSVTEKNEAPSSNKKIVEGTEDKTSNDVNIWDTVNYKATIEVKAGAVNYKFIDTMSDGLTLNDNSIEVKVGDTKIEASSSGKTNYTFQKGSGTNDPTFTITFNNDWIASQVGKTIVITYSATLNENAVVAGAGNSNEGKLEYGNKPEGSRDNTPPSTTTTKTWEFSVEKFTYVGTGDRKTEQKLAGAKFKLCTDEAGSQAISLVDASTTTPAAMIYRHAKTGETNTVTEITTNDTGKFTIKGLDAGEYYLVETEAPAGYNKLTTPTKVTIDANGDVKKDSDATALTDKTVKVENKTGSTLPSTGGMGTTLFYVIGSILALGAVILMVTKRRMNAR